MEVRHQILGLRDYTNGSGKVHKKDTFYEKHWGAPTLKELFHNLQTHVEKIPSEERYNIYFTVAESSGKREFVRQKYIPFDIDDIDVSRAKETVEVALKALGLKWEEVPSVFSGNGVQFFVELEEHFTDPQFFDKNRFYYKTCCEKIERHLRVANLPGKVDTSVFSLARLMRFPGTLNKKPDKPTRLAEILQNNFVPLKFSLAEACGIPIPDKKDVLAKWPPPDTKAVLEGCANIKKMLEEPDDVQEPLWYANASIIGRLGGNPVEARRIWHEYSSKYKGYTAEEADRKLDQALAGSKPRTCQNMAALTGSKCDGCAHKGKVKSPILITGEDYIATKETGFHKIIIDSEGKLKPSTPAYLDLLKFFQQQHSFVVNDVGIVYAFNGIHYEKYSDIRVKSFAQRWFSSCDTRKANEFYNLVLRSSQKDTKFFEDGTVDGKVNFPNGVLDIHTNEFTEGHSPDHPFMYVLPFEYEPKAVAPRFDAFLDEVTLGDKELRQMLLEFGGYALSNDKVWDHRALILVGGGANGKSVFLNVLSSLAGEAHSAVSMRNLSNDQHMAALEGKLLNLSDEGFSGGFKETDIFKTLVSGGEITVKTVYEKPYKIRNKAKLVFACNEIPNSTDMEEGFRRRLAIVPFNATFTGAGRDPFLMSKLNAERAGIFNMMLAAYHEMHKRGGLATAEQSEKSLKEYQIKTDPVITWVAECLEILPFSQDFVAEQKPFVAFKDIYASYVNFCDEYNVKPMSRISFALHLKNRIPHYGSRSIQKKLAKNNLQVLLGVNLTDKETI